MLKKIAQALLVAVCFFGMVFTTTAQDKSYEMYESVTLTPDNSKLKALGENLHNHNKKYHNEGAYQAYVYNISTGPNIGKIVWEMGPLMFKHLDSRPSADGHDEDWRDNVLVYTKKMSHGEYWKKDEKLSNDGASDDQPKHLYIRYFEVVKNEGHNVNRMLELISKTVKAMEGDNPWSVYYNEFRQGDLGRHIATVSPFNTWAELDEDEKFKETFIKIHGEGEWEPFLENMNDSFSNSWDEIWSYNAFMSGK